MRQRTRSGAAFSLAPWRRLRLAEGVANPPRRVNQERHAGEEKRPEARWKRSAESTASFSEGVVRREKQKRIDEAIIAKYTNRHSIYGHRDQTNQKQKNQRSDQNIAFAVTAARDKHARTQRKHDAEQQCKADRRHLLARDAADHDGQR